MTNELLISIIIPVYNVENYLRKCLDSVIKQTYNSIEIILIDDGSSDKSGAICDEYAKMDSRIMVLHKTNEGVAQARIDGFNKSKGGLITFIDADDYVDLQYIERLMMPFLNYDIDLCTCEYYDETNSLLVHSKRSVHGFLSREHINDMLANKYLYDKQLSYAGLPIFLVTKMIKREFVLDALLYARGLWWGEDQVASFYILTKIKAMFALSNPMYYYVHHKGQATQKYDSSLWTNQFECWKRYKELDCNFLLINQLPLRMWWTIKQNFKKMAKCNLSYRQFKNEMQLIEKTQMWKGFVRSSFLVEGKREKLFLFLLRYHLYYTFYCFILRRI